MGVPLAIAGFVGTVIGGIGNLLGAVLGGFSLVSLRLCCRRFCPKICVRRAMRSFTPVILVLLLRPQGLFARRGVGERI